jgi:glycosyltransferase involved in cell wall biosynthesis
LTNPAHRVLVAHPGRQHSARAAHALERAGLLAAYWAGVPLTGALGRPVPGIRVPATKLTPAPWCPLLRRIVEAVAPGRAQAWGDRLANRTFDRWAARRARAGRFDLVIGFEAGCERLFAAARSTGAVTVLDAASLHHAAQDRWRRAPDPEALHRRIVETKDRELETARHLVVASEIAAESYRAAGFDPHRTWTVPLGVDLERFPRGPGGGGGELAVLFVGKPSEVKGIDLLVAALERARGRSAAVVLRVAGQGAGAVPLPPHVRNERLDPLDLVEAYGRADVLVLPSRFDGYGLVVPEALCCGAPVIVSDRVGAKELIQEGSNGWIVPAEDVEALASRLVWCAAHLDRVRSMREAAAQSAKAASWDLYYERYAGVVRAILAAEGR